MYVGFLFSDYMSYDNMARMVAREAAITGPVNSSYKGLEQQYGTMIENAHMTTNLYEFSTITIKSTQGMSGNSVPSDGVQVEITTKLNNQYAFVICWRESASMCPRGIRSGTICTMKKRQIIPAHNTDIT